MKSNQRNLILSKLMNNRVDLQKLHQLLVFRNQDISYMYPCFNHRFNAFASSVKVENGDSTLIKHWVTLEYDLETRQFFEFTKKIVFDR